MTDMRLASIRYWRGEDSPARFSWMSKKRRAPTERSGPRVSPRAGSWHRATSPAPARPRTGSGFGTPRLIVGGTTEVAADSDCVRSGSEGRYVKLGPLLSGQGAERRVFAHIQRPVRCRPLDLVLVLGVRLQPQEERGVLRVSSRAHVLIDGDLAVRRGLSIPD